MPHGARRQSLRLSTQVVLLLLGIIVLTVAGGSVVSFAQTRASLDQRAGEKALGIARTVAEDPFIIAAMAQPDPSRAIQPAMERLRRTTGVAFIVVANRQGVRYSHPNPSLIGASLFQEPQSNPAAVLAGDTFVGVQTGSLGRSMRARVPVHNATGQVIGLVSVGVLEANVSAQMWAALPATLIAPLLGLVVGVLGAVFLARRIKRQTFGLEPPEIATLLEQREAMLHGVREGTVTLDASGHVTLANDEARRLLQLDPEVVGQRLADVLPVEQVREVLTGPTPGRDELVLVGGRVLVVNRTPVDVRGQHIGMVVTLRDRTELEALLREIDDLRNLSEALRAQEHEFASKLHVIGGLVELRRYDDAVRFINRSSQLHQDLAAVLLERRGDPILAALLLGKCVVAGERGVQLKVSEFVDVTADLGDSAGLVTIVGNLVDNALESAAGAPAGTGVVEVAIGCTGECLVIWVRDNGSGVDPVLVDDIFARGFSTKVEPGGRSRRGLGLALVSNEVRRRGGHIEVANQDGASFTVTIPLGVVGEPPVSAREVPVARPLVTS